jgi:hypothetical protein
VTWSERALIAGGTTRRYAHVNYGTTTLRLQQPGFYTLSEAAPGKPKVGCSGPSTDSHKILYLDFRVPGCMGELTARWTFTNNELRLHVLRATDPGDRVLFGRKPWKKTD